MRERGMELSSRASATSELSALLRLVYHRCTLFRACLSESDTYVFTG